MSIELHCPQCQKLIRAPDNAGGRRGKCPYCKNSVYIPTPPEEREEIGLAPIDEDEEKQAEEERRKAIRFVTKVDHATEGGEGLSAEDLAQKFDEPPGDIIDIDAEIETYVLAMKNSKLEDAEAAVKRLQRVGQRARDHVEHVMVDEMAPEVEDVPGPVVKGFLKKLLDELNE